MSSLDSRIKLFSRISPEIAKYLENKNISILSDEGHYFEFMDEEDYKKEQNDNIRKYMTPVHAKINTTDWNSIIRSVGEDPEKIHIFGIGPFTISVGETYENQRKYDVNTYSKEFEIEEEETLYFYESIEIYRWRRNEAQDKIKALFDKEFPESYNSYSKKYEQIYDKEYRLTDNLVLKMKSLDPEFAEKFNESYVEDMYYSADW